MHFCAVGGRTGLRPAPLIGIERLAAQLPGQRGLANRGLAHDQGLRAPPLDRLLAQRSQKRQHFRNALSLHLPRRTGQTPIAGEVEFSQSGELADRVRDLGQLVGGKVELGQGGGLPDPMGDRGQPVVIEAEPSQGSELPDRVPDLEQAKTRQIQTGAVCSRDLGDAALRLSVGTFRSAAR
jgi:hypothetical protein